MKLNKKIKKILVLIVILFIFTGIGIVLKNEFLDYAEKRIRNNFSFEEIQLSLFPPTLVITQVKSLTPSPFFSAKKVVVKISFRALLTRKRPIQAFIEDPVLRVFSPDLSMQEEDRPDLRLALPFAVEKGIIKNGELHYWGKDIRIHSREIHALFSQRQDRYYFRGESGKNVIVSGAFHENIAGRLNVIIEGQKGSLQVRRLKFHGPGNYISARGRIENVENPSIQLRTSYKIDVPSMMTMLRIPFDWEGTAEGSGLLTREDGILGFKSNFSSRNLNFNESIIRRVRGSVEFDENKGGEIEVILNRENFLRESLLIRFAGKQVDGQVFGVYLDPIMRNVRFPWPVGSPAWGNFSLKEGRLSVEAEFRDDRVRSEEEGFPLLGQVQFHWDGKDRLAFSSPRLVSSFGQVELKGDVVLKKELDVSIKGQVKDVKEARLFTSLILERNLKFPEISGEGDAEIHIKGHHIHPHIEMKFSLSPGGFQNFQGRHVYGEAEIIRDEFAGNFQVEDPVYTGKIGVFVNKDDVEAYFHVLQGSVRDILAGLNIRFPLEGNASGDFTYMGHANEFQVGGEFFGSNLKLAGLPIKNVQGELEATDHSVLFPRIACEVNEGEVNGTLSLDFASKEFRIELRGEEIDLSVWNPRIRGLLSLEASGGGQVNRDKAVGSLEILDFEVSPFQKTRVEGDLVLGLTDHGLILETDGNFLPGENDFMANINLPFGDEDISVDIKGAFRNLDLLVPWKGVAGVVNYRADLMFQEKIPTLNGVLDLQGSLFPFPRFPYALRNYSGLIFFKNGHFSLRSLKGEMGEGSLQASGFFQVGKSGLERISLQAEGNQMQLSLLERTKVLTDGNLTLEKNGEKFELGGEFLVQNLIWNREFNEKIAFSSDPYYESGKESGFFDDINLNVRLIADDNVMFENSLGKFLGRFDLVIRGNINAPVLTGEMEALGGEVFFQDRSFDILRGKVSFLNPTATEPYISFNGETFVKDYRVTFSLDGFMDNLNPEFGSSPPLPQEDVLALLALGEAFRRTYHYDRSSQQGTASLLSFQLYEEAKKSAEKLFGIDRFRIDPFVLGSSAEMTARLTIGKKISRNFFILYSTNLSSQREEITRIEWELTNDLSIVGTRDEEGRVSIDVKIHKRF